MATITVQYGDEVEKFSLLGKGSSLRSQLQAKFKLQDKGLILTDEKDKYDVVIDNNLPGGSYRLEVKDAKKSTRKFPWLHPALVVRPKNSMLYGLYSTAFLPAGTVIWQEVPEAQDYLFYTKEETKSWPKEEREDWEDHCFQVDESTHSGERVKRGTPLAERNRDDFTNHSCDPSTWILTDEQVVARRDINIGDEITYDYCTTESENSTHVNKWKCLCGAKDCRGMLTGKEYLDPVLQKKYDGHWGTYLQQRIDAIRAQKSEK